MVEIFNWENAELQGNVLPRECDPLPDANFAQSLKISLRPVQIHPPFRSSLQRAVEVFASIHLNCHN